MVIRFDAGFWSNKTVKTLSAQGGLHHGGAHWGPEVAAAMAAVYENDWTEIAYTASGRPQVAETECGRRLIVRRTPLRPPPRHRLVRLGRTR
jgi:hypothetical protein